MPIGIYRGFRSLSDRPDALMMAIVGGPDAGKVDWHPSVLAEARNTGLASTMTAIWWSKNRRHNRFVMAGQKARSAVFAPEVHGHP